MALKERREIARRLPKTHDTKYNKGKEDYADGRTYTEEAKYFMQCEFLI